MKKKNSVIILSHSKFNSEASSIGLGNLPNLIIAIEYKEIALPKNKNG